MLDSDAPRTVDYSDRQIIELGEARSSPSRAAHHSRIAWLGGGLPLAESQVPNQHGLTPKCPHNNHSLRTAIDHEEVLGNHDL